MIATEETALATREEYSTELAPTQAEAMARQEIQAAVVLAKRFPRNEDAAFQRLTTSCKRPAFAADVTYSFPRGGTTVTGPSIYLAREFARLWGNIRHGCDVVADDDEQRTIRAWAWDLETNVKVTSDVTFKKLVQRKRSGVTQWVEPDERDLRELTNKHAAIAKRNCLFELLPCDMVDDAIAISRRTLLDRAAKDPDELRKNIITGFGSLHITVENLEAYLGHKIAQCTPAELVELRGHYKSIMDGNTTWGEVAAAKASSATKSDALAEKLAGQNGAASKPSEPVPPVESAAAAKASAKTLGKLKAAIKDQQLTDAGVAAAMKHLGLTGDPFKLSEDDTLRLTSEINEPTISDSAE